MLDIRFDAFAGHNIRSILPFPRRYGRSARPRRKCGTDTPVKKAGFVIRMGAKGGCQHGHRLITAEKTLGVPEELVYKAATTFRIVETSAEIRWKPPPKAVDYIVFPLEAIRNGSDFIVIGRPIPGCPGSRESRRSIG